MGDGKRYRKDRESEEQRNKLTNDTNYQIAQENLAFQRENLDYQKALQQELFQREDTQIQRQVSDARAAGISPLAVGLTGGSAGSAVQTSPLVDTFQASEGHPVANRSQQAMDMLNGLGTIVNLASQVATVGQQVEGIKLDNESKRLSNSFNSMTFNSRVSRDEVETILARYNALGEREKRYYNSYFGITEGMPQNERYAHILSRHFGIPLNSFDSSGKNFRSSFEDYNRPFSSITNYSTPVTRNLDELLDSVSKLISDGADTVSTHLSEAIKDYKDKKSKSKASKSNHESVTTPYLKTDDFLQGF